MKRQNKFRNILCVFVTVVILFTVMTHSVSAETLTSFSDVNENSYYYDAVSWAVNNGVTTGVGNGKFAPTMSCTRAQIVTFLWREQNQPEPKIAFNPFVDVKSTDYYYKAVLWAVENGITTGTSVNTFSPDGDCTRAQAVTFLWRANGSNDISNITNKFIDIDTNSYYTKAVAWAVYNGITTGTSETTFSPNNNCDRAQIVTFLHRNQKSSPSESSTFQIKKNDILKTYASLYDYNEYSIDYVEIEKEDTSDSEFTITVTIGAVMLMAPEDVDYVPNYIKGYWELIKDGETVSWDIFTISSAEELEYREASFTCKNLEAGDYTLYFRSYI